MKTPVTILLIFSVHFASTWNFFGREKYYGGYLRLLEGQKLNRTYNAPAQWAIQKLDNFNNSLATIWKQQYFVNKNHHKPGGPAFLMIGGGLPIGGAFVERGAMFEYAKEVGALLFHLEHRFYGDSRPTKDMSTENLKYLSTAQALADAASFIKQMTQKYRLSANTKWIVFGGFYAGNLAAWMRLKYPDLVQGALCSSGPVLAKVHFKEYYQHVEADFRAVSESCVDEIHGIFSLYDQHTKSESGRTYLKKLLNTCAAMENDLDISWQSLILSTYFAVAVQHSTHGYREKMCSDLMNSNGKDSLERYADYMRFHVGECMDYRFSSAIQPLKNTDWSGDITRQWIYQTCTELGYFQTAEENESIFAPHNKLNVYFEMCKQTYGEKFNDEFINSGVQATNSVYGGLGINATNIVYVNGEYDPWSRISLLEPNNPDSPTINIKGTTFCEDLRASSPNDVPELTKAREDILNLIKKWIQ